MGVGVVSCFFRWALGVSAGFCGLPSSHMLDLHFPSPGNWDGAVGLVLAEVTPVPSGRKVELPLGDPPEFSFPLTGAWPHLGGWLLVPLAVCSLVAS